MRGNAIARNTIRGNGSRYGVAFARLSCSKTSKAPMAQNIYDRPEFFEGYSRLGRSIAGLSGAPEWSALKAMLPEVRGRRVMDLGCGFGWFCRWAAEEGAAEVLGIDLSQKMLARARAETPEGVISYREADLEALALGEGSADLIYSSLAFHYIADAARLYASIHKALAPGGHLVFSTEHPIFMASTNPGWREAEAGVKTWPVDHYFMEGPRSTDWLSAGVVKYHRTVGTTVNTLIQAGFTITHVEEFCPTTAQIAANPALAQELERPMFLLVSAVR
jgi:SAM-dependent methyltransferase